MSCAGMRPPRAGAGSQLQQQHQLQWVARPGHCSAPACRRSASVRRRAAQLGAAADDGGEPAAAGMHQQQPPQPVNYAPTDRQQLWMAAIKPPMYSVGVVPVLVGAAAAYFDHGVVPWGCFASLLLGAICIIAWLNLSNDAFDATTGVDVHKAESVVNLTGNRTAVLLAAKAFLAAGLGLLGSGIAAAHDTRVAAMLGAAIACGYLYQGPPFRLSYKGLGEPLCFTAFGPLATTAFYLAMSHGPAASAASAAAASAAASPAAGALAGTSPLLWLLGLVVGVTTTVILFCSHWHQIAGDIAAGKMSPLVRLGTARACEVLRASVAAPYALALGGAAAGVLPLPVLACLALSLPAAQALLAFAFEHHAVPARIAALKRYGVRWHIAVGLALSAGLVLTRLLPQ